MQQIIQGNDTTVSVILYQQSIHLSGTADDTQVESAKINLRQVKEISVRLIPYMRWEEVSPSFSVRDNVLEVAFPATQQRQGKWDIDISFLMPSVDGGYKQARVKQAFAEVLPTNYPTSTLSAYVVSAEVTTAMRGETGLDAYQTALTRGLVTSYEEWIEYIRGPQGDKGDTGKDAYAYYLETTTDSPKLSEEQWANYHNHYLSVLHRIVFGESVPMQGRKSTGDYLLELHTTIDRLASALQSKDIDVREQSGLASFIPKIKAYEPMHIVLFKQTQLYTWQQRSLGRFVEISPAWSSPDLSYMFASNNALERLPEIRGIDRVVSIASMAKDTGVQGEVRIPNLPMVTSSNQSFSSNKSIERVLVGDMPMCKNISQMVYNCPKLRYAELGSIPLAEDASHIFASCPSLVQVIFRGGVAPSSSATSMFEGDGSLRSVDGVIDLSSVSSYQNIVYGCDALESIKIKGLGDNINLSRCASLSAESLRYIIDNAKTVTGKTIYLPRTFFETRRDEMETLGRQATSKGFTINYI
jgi:hypothetical protein